MAIDKWTGRLVGKMHNEQISNNDLAAKLGLNKSYVSMVLNCQRRPPNAKERFEKAVDEIIEERKQVG